MDHDMPDPFDAPFMFGLDDLAAQAPGGGHLDEPAFSTSTTSYSAQYPYDFAPSSLPSFGGLHAGAYGRSSFAAPTAIPAMPGALPPLPSTLSGSMAIPQASRSRGARSPPSARLCASLDTSADMSGAPSLSSASLQGLAPEERREAVMAVRRERNRVAAERCRARRVMLIQDLQDSCATLRAERDRLAEENRVLAELLARSGLSFDEQ